MKTNKPMLYGLTLVLVALMAFTPIQTANPQESPPQGPQESWVALCIVVGAAAAVTGIILVARKCRPQYYCMKDGEDPPNYFIGTATDKECEINGWERVNGPYDTADEVPPCNSSTPTNLTQHASAPMLIKVEASTDLNFWQTIHEETCDPDVFGYALTNRATMFYRYKISSL